MPDVLHPLIIIPVVFDELAISVFLEYFLKSFTMAAEI
jgi:hypothetical protein